MPQDTLFIGTESSLLAYDVERNADIFFRELQDGANALLVGRVATVASPLIIVGGNCSVLGFNKLGSESFWTVTGDNVSSLEVCDVDGDGNVELLVGSEDFEIRVFRHEELLHEISETDKIIFLKEITKDRFAYGLSNGTVGVYKGPKTRAWRVKSKLTLTALHVFDMDADGIPEIISGFSNGSFTVRNESNGEIKFKGSLGSAIVAIKEHDYRLTGKKELIVCSESGEVRGYLPVTAEMAPPQKAAMDDAEDLKILNELQQKKSELTNELRLIEQGLRNAKAGDSSGALPANTSLSFDLFADSEIGCVTLVASVSTELQIITLIATDTEGIAFAGNEVQAVSPINPGRAASLNLKISKSQPCTLRVQAHLAVRGSSSQMHVLEGEVFLPRFAVFSEISSDAMQTTKQPKSRVSFEMNETVGAIFNWLKGSFILTPNGMSRVVSKNHLNIGFISVAAAASEGGQRSHYLFIEASGEGNTVKMQIISESMDICGDIVQDLARHFKLEDLDTYADFPKEFKKFEGILDNVSEANSARLHLLADMADDSQRVKV